MNIMLTSREDFYIFYYSILKYKVQFFESLYSDPIVLNSPNYEFRIKMYNKFGGLRGGSDFGNFGIIYNVIDEDNFDFVYLTLR